MKNILKKFISFILIVTLFLGSTTSAFGNNRNILSEAEIKKDLEKDYRIRGEINTPYGKVYVLTDKNKLIKPGERFSIWDIADFAMAGISWARLFNDPSWSNLGVAVIDTVGLLPLIPSLSTARNSKEALEMIAKEYKTNKKVRDQINATKKAEIKYPIKKGEFNFNESAAKHIDDPARTIPIHIIKEALKTKRYPDPRGMPGYYAYYIKIYRNGKPYNFEIVYNPSTNTIQHFKFSEKAMGPLKAIK